MKKTILSLAILLASSAGISAFAQAPAQKAQTSKNNTEIKARKGGERKQAHDPFEGLNLTDKQKSQLKDLNPYVSKEKVKEILDKGKAGRDQMQAEDKAIRKERLAQDKARREERRAQDKVRNEQRRARFNAQTKELNQASRQARLDYLAKVKAVLSPEQYIQFLETNFVDKADMNMGHRKVVKSRVHRKSDKKGRKAQGPRKGGKPGQKGQNSGRPDGKADKGADKK